MTDGHKGATENFVRLEGVRSLAHTAKLDAPRLAYAGQEGSLRATAAGTPAGLDWTVQGRATEGAINGRGRLAQENGARRLDLAALEAQAMGESVRLAAPTRGQSTPAESAGGAFVKPKMSRLSHPASAPMKWPHRVLRGLAAGAVGV